MTTRPNILLIQADQMTPLLMGTYGHPVVQTPHIDRLGAGGVRFDAAYSPCPVCGPARACMVTGKYTSSNRAYDNAALLAADEPAMGHYLTLGGYDTVVSGKLHFVGPDQLHGFNRRLTPDFYPADFSWTWMMTADGAPANQAHNYVGDGVEIDRWNNEIAYDEDAHLRALEYLHAKGLPADKRPENHDGADPFFLWVSYQYPHDPFWPSQELWDLYSDEEIELPLLPENLDETYSAMDRWLNEYHGVAREEMLKDPESIRRVRRAYYALNTYVDRRVGELLATLRNSGLADNTVVVFCSDHGDMLCEKGMVQKRGFYEMSSRVPLIMRFPDGFKRNTVCKQPVNLIDLLPTFLDLAGVPNEVRLPMDGRSLMDMLNGANAESCETFSENHADGMIEAPCFMLRQGRYKYIHIHGHENQLFDLEADPGEWVNLAGHPDHADTEARMKARILARFDPDAIAADVERTFHQRRLIDRAMKRNQTSWAYRPQYDPDRAITARTLRSGERAL